MSTPGERRAALAVGALVFAVHASCPIKTSFDSLWAIPTAASLLRRGDWTLDEYAAGLALRAHGTATIGDATRFSFPIGAPLVAVPFLALGDGLVAAVAPLGSRFPRVQARVDEWRAGLGATGTPDWAFDATMELVISSLLVALATALLLLTAAPLAGLRTATVAALAFAFTTPAWSTASRALWSHSPALVCSSLALLALLRGAGRPLSLATAGLALGAGYVCRPTGAVTLVCLGLAAGWRWRARAWPLVAGAALPLICFGCWSAAVYGTLLPPYYAGSRLGVSASAWLEALGGNVLAPSRGLVWFCPAALLALGAAWLPLPALERPWQVGLALWVALHWALVSSFPHWWAGHSFGPRFMVDVLPALLLLALPAARWLTELPGARRRLALAMLGSALAFGAAVHARAAVSWAPWSWNERPADVDERPERVWQLSDPQWLR